MRLYYHKTSGGAEYLYSAPVEGTEEGSFFKSKYIVRIDGDIEKDAEIFIREDQEEIDVVFVGIDRFNRPVFRDSKRNHYGSTDKLYPYGETIDVIKDFDSLNLIYFGRSFNCEPEGYPVKEKLILKEKL